MIRKPPPPKPTREQRCAALVSSSLRPTVQAVMMAGPARASVPVKKAKPVRSEAYRRLVAALPCDWCGAVGISQAAHPNTGKGAGIKTDDRLCFPLCADSVGRVGCHTMMDRGALMTKEMRREYEPAAGRRTREAIERAGAWPVGVERWDNVEVTGKPLRGAA